tara:strand:- start:475 stop:1194 length:720 start_codon:yes stop_codon:yes gene_type:complete
MKKISLLLVLILSTGSAYAQDPCQEIVHSITSSSTPFLEYDSATGDSLIYYHVCLGDQITFVADASFPENNTNYLQTIANTDFTWFLDGDEVISALQYTTTFTTGGLYELAITSTDVNGCENTEPFSVFISVASIEHSITSSSHSPTFETDSITGDTIIYYDLCIGEELTLNANASFPQINNSNPQTQDSTEFTWYVDNVEVYTGLEYTHTYTTSGGFILSITSADINDCAMRYLIMFM